jgi:hypothetical protein
VFAIRDWQTVHSAILAALQRPYNTPAKSSLRRPFWHSLRLGIKNDCMAQIHATLAKS